MADGNGFMYGRIGDFLVQIGAMTQEQVQEVLRIQQNDPARLFGQIAIECGYIDDEALRRYVEHKHAAGVR